MKIKNSCFVLITFFSMLHFSCKKEAGEGGMASITGKVMIDDYDNTFTILRRVYPAQGEMVFIVYGQDKGVSDNVRTSYDGTFEFKYLRLGKYKVFAVSKDTSDRISNKTIEVLREVDITEKSKTYTVEDLHIAD
jgi:hypothetical protein